MSSMPLDLYDALTGANIAPEKAKLAVESLQEQIDMQVGQANQAVLAKLDGVQTTVLARLDALVTGRIEPVERALTQSISDKQLRVQRLRWVIGTMLATIGAGYTVLHALHLL